jgi:hypothetical protein
MIATGDTFKPYMGMAPDFQNSGPKLIPFELLVVN